MIKMWDFLVGSMAIVGAISITGALIIITHCYFATRSVYKQMNDLNKRMEQGE